MPEIPKQQFNVYLPAPLVRRVKHASVDSSESLSRFVEHALEHYLASLQKSPTKPAQTPTQKGTPR